MPENDHNNFNNETLNNVNNDDAKYAKNDVKATNYSIISSMKDKEDKDKYKYKDKQTRGDIDPHDKRPRFPSQYNEHFFADGSRRRIEYVYYEQGNKVRPKTVLEQTGRRKPYKQSEKERLAIEWRRTKMSELMVMGKNMPEISKILHIPMSTIKNDYIYLKNQAREEIKNHIDDLPLQIKNAIQGLDKLISMLYYL